MSGVPPAPEELQTWKSNHLYAAWAYDCAHGRLLALNSDELSQKLKRIIRRLVSRSSTDGSTPSISSTKTPTQNASPSAADSKECGKASSKEGKATSAALTSEGLGDLQASGKKRDRLSGGGGVPTATKQEGEEDVRPGKCGRVSPEDASKAARKQPADCPKQLGRVVVANDASKPKALVEGAGASRGQKTQQEGSKGSGNTGSAKSSSDAGAAAPAKTHAGSGSLGRKEGKWESKGSQAAMEAGRPAGREGSPSGKAGSTSHSSAQPETGGKDMQVLLTTGSISGLRTPEGIAGEGKGFKSKDASAKKMHESGSDAQRMRVSKDAGGEDAEAEESDSGQDEVRARACEKKRVVAAKKIALGRQKPAMHKRDGQETGGHPQVARGAMDTESTDSNGISGGGSPASAGGLGIVAAQDLAAVSSPSCHGFSAGGDARLTPLSPGHSRWKIVTFESFGRATSAPGAEGAMQIPSGRRVCVAFDLRPIKDSARLQALLDQITFKGCPISGGNAGSSRAAGTSGSVAWTCGLEQRAKLSGIGDLVCGEVRVSCRAGKYMLKACSAGSNGESEDFPSECAVDVVPGHPSLHRSALTLHLVTEKGVQLASRCRNGKHSARAATAPSLMGAFANTGQDVHVELSIETLCDDAGNILKSSQVGVEELTALLRVTHVFPLMWGEAQTAVAAVEGADESKGSGESRLSIDAETESVSVRTAAVMPPATAGCGAPLRVRLFTLRPEGAGNHVLLFRALVHGLEADGNEGTLFFHVDLLACNKTAS